MKKNIINYKFSMLVILMFCLSSIVKSNENPSNNLSFFSDLNVVDILNTGVTGFAFLVLLLGYRLTTNVQSKILEKDPNNFKNPDLYEKWSLLMKSQLNNTKHFMVFSFLFFLGGLFLLIFKPENEILVHINPYQNVPLNPVLTHQGDKISFDKQGYSKFKVQSDHTIQLTFYKLFEEINKLRYALEDKNKNVKNELIKNNKNLSDSILRNQTRNDLYTSFDKAKQNNNTGLSRIISNNLGVIAYAEGDHEVAKSFFTNEWAINSGISNEFLKYIHNQENKNKIYSYIASGVSYILKNEPQKAVIEYNKALKLNPNNVRALEYKGYALFLLNEHSESIAISQKANSIDPNNLNVVLNLLKSNCAIKRNDKVKQVIKNNNQILLRNNTTVENDKQLSRVCDINIIDNI